MKHLIILLLITIPLALSARKSGGVISEDTYISQGTPNDDGAEKNDPSEETPKDFTWYHWVFFGLAWLVGLWLIGMGEKWLRRT